MTHPRATIADDRVLPYTRVLAAAVTPFLLVGSTVLNLWPNDTGRLFAWPIRPPVTAMVLGSAYLGGAYFFVRVVRASSWHSVKTGFVAVALFASLLGIVTILHWDRFNHRHVAFWLWSGLYFTTPFLVVGAWLANGRREVRRAPGDVVLPAVARAVVGASGMLALGVGLLLFLAPVRAVEFWPWSLTPLTARVLGAVLCLGVAGIGMLVDPRWSSGRLMVETATVMVTLMLVAGLRAYSQFDRSNPLTWLFLGGLTATLLGCVLLYAAMTRRTAATS
jgi:hypothetical protein